ncbi:MAG: PaaI family thioesterase [Allosphingosinicella sp.]
MDLHPLILHEPALDFPGWWTWDMLADNRFNATIGRMLVRPDGPGRATCRMFPEERHLNLQGVIHGGALLTFLDIALFAGGRLAGADVLGAVTLDLNAQFVDVGRIGVPIDAQVELIRETRRLVFLQGKVVQDGETIAAFSGALRKSSGRA